MLRTRKAGLTGWGLWVSGAVECPALARALQFRECPGFPVSHARPNGHKLCALQPGSIVFFSAH